MSVRTTTWVVGLGCFFVVGSAGLGDQPGRVSAPGDRARCNADCGIATIEFLERCIADDGTQSQCDAAARTFQRECKRRCKRPQTCERTCRVAANAAFEKCIAGGGSQGECETVATQVLRECIENQCAAPLPCTDVCIRRSADALSTCVSNGGALAECVALARPELDACLIEHCTLPTACAELCVALSEATRELCILSGGSNFECNFITDEALDICFVTRCEGDECVAACFVEAMVAFRECKANGGQTTECALASIRFLEQCRLRCDRVCGGIAGIACSPGLFCRFETGTCTIADNMGLCTAIPRACPDVWDPVCGCDGVTYGNRCEADTAAMSIDHVGVCVQ